MSLSRREWLQRAGLAAGALALPALGPARAEATGLSPELERSLTACSPHDDPLGSLLRRNARFSRAWQAAATAGSAQERTTLMNAIWQRSCQLDPSAMASGQRPWAALLSCADSRVSPEWIFVSGAGELFDVRCAGNTAFDDGVASLEYAVAELEVPLILVMGHSGCGAVTAALAEAPLTPLLEHLVTPIRAALQPGDDLSLAISHNASHSAQELSRRSPLLREAVGAGRLRIQPACFDIASGAVTLL
ncbi:carbonic anhydrase [Synechococcus sp. BSF8S]|uniref:carbonic anhydrase n=1 Tax=Synechococcales TaxID=1890424 RepID=UPI00162806F0|nr:MULTISPECIES: carbonic anhydrase [unclassified Synechococcus]MBC1261256.1 carbonic anhydrase [Synechococcus sp. BSF8S]MBC1264159.1 carbonic anhydrase [Synechococcus sp. BSA11S]